jgi:transposase
MRRHELTDGEWRLVEPLLPRQARVGRWNDHRTTLSGMLWVLRTGASWRDLPERFGRWQSVYDRFNRWRRDGTFDRIAKAFRIRLDRKGKIDWDLWCIDGTSVRAARSAAGASKERAGEPEDHALGRSHGGWGSKLHLVSDGAGVPLATCVTAGQAHESTQFERLMQEVLPPRRERWPGKAAGDKGYRYPRVRHWLARRGIEAVIPQRSDEVERDGDLGLDRRAYRRRSAVERCVGWLKECRRVGTRFDKLAGSFMAFVRLAFTQRYLRLLDPLDRT